MDIICWQLTGLLLGKITVRYTWLPSVNKREIKVCKKKKKEKKKRRETRREKERITFCIATLFLSFSAMWVSAAAFPRCLSSSCPFLRLLQLTLREKGERKKGKGRKGIRFGVDVRGGCGWRSSWIADSWVRSKTDLVDCRGGKRGNRGRKEEEKF